MALCAAAPLSVDVAVPATPEPPVPEPCPGVRRPSRSRSRSPSPCPGLRPSRSPSPCRPPRAHDSPPREHLPSTWAAAASAADGRPLRRSRSPSQFRRQPPRGRAACHDGRGRDRRPFADRDRDRGNDRGFGRGDRRREPEYRRWSRGQSRDRSRSRSRSPTRNYGQPPPPPPPLPALPPFVAVLVPYRPAPRQNRQWQFAAFCHVMPRVLDAALGPGRWRIYLGEQLADTCKFARGRVLNALAACAKQDLGVVNVRYVLHDVDLLPTVQRARLYGVPWRAADGALMPACALWPDGKYSGGAYADKFVGGVLGIDAAAFWHVGGFFNGFEGWGGEDDAFASACAARGVGILQLPRDGAIGNMTDLEVGFCRVPGQVHASRASDAATKHRLIREARTHDGLRNCAAALMFQVCNRTVLETRPHDVVLLQLHVTIDKVGPVHTWHNGVPYFEKRNERGEVVLVFDDYMNAADAPPLREPRVYMDELLELSLVDVVAS